MSHAVIGEKIARVWFVTVQTAVQFVPNEWHSTQSEVRSPVYVGDRLQSCRREETAQSMPSVQRRRLCAETAPVGAKCRTVLMHCARSLCLAQFIGLQRSL